MKTHRKKSRRERGYLMVGLLAMMTISLVMMAAALPQLEFESQREREEEMLWRGQQIAMALQAYGVPGKPLTSLEELVQGVPVGFKKVRLLRRSALWDPMLPYSGDEKSNWRLVHPQDQVIASMVSSLDSYIAKKEKENPELAGLLKIQRDRLNVFAPRVQGGGLTDGFQGTQNNQNSNPNQNPDGQNDPGRSLLGGLQSDQRPIIGVVSRSDKRTVRQMLDLERYDEELFFAGGVVIAGGFITPYFAGTSGTQSPQANPCPNGGFYLPDSDGKLRCFGGLFDGQRPPSTRP